MRIALMTLIEKIKSRYASTVVLDTDCEVSLFISEVLRVQILLHLTVLEIVMIKPCHQNIRIMSQKHKASPRQCSQTGSQFSKSDWRVK